MAITGAALQAALGGLQNSIVLREYKPVSTFQEWLVCGINDARGRTRLVRTTAADDAATQAAAVLVALRA